MPVALRKYIAEAIGTFALVFCGTGAIIINDVTVGGITHVGIAITFGLVVMVMIYALGDLSGAHINPAVTLAFYAARRLPSGELAPYIFAQTSGAVAASITLHALFPDSNTLGETTPAGNQMQSFLMETILTFLLMFVILGVSTGSKEKGITAGIAIGSMVGLEAMFAGPVSGASMNPARSFAPALISGNMTGLWIYIASPVAGALLAVFVSYLVKPEKQISA